MKSPMPGYRFARLRRWPWRGLDLARKVRYCTIGAAVFGVQLITSCDPRIVIATPTCTSATTGQTLFGDDRSNVESNEPIELPWSTGFERGFCDYWEASGYCYTSGTAAYKLVESPVHNGRFAAAFSVTVDSSLTIMQTRCVRQGRLPPEAYYGAWYLVPSIRKSAGFWNLIHFHGGSSASDAENLWDVSLVNDSTGALRLSVYNHIAQKLYDLPSAATIPIGAWFRIQVYLKRAADATGVLVVYLDGFQVLQLSGLVTDNTTWGEWYVGNLGISLDPPESTLFVDDITVSKSL
ncbi:MAG TPA: hypothetical protein VIV60_00315 [Polyangiaceae bacterium]